MLRELRRSKSGAGDSGEDDPLEDRITMGLKGVQALPHEVYQTPDKVIGRYEAERKRHLGITDGRQFWRAHDFSRCRQTRFGRTRGMFRLYVAVGDILNHSVRQRCEVVGAMLAQCQI